METRITKLLGIEYPIIQGGMAWVAEYNLAAAVSNAGGFGIIGAASAPPEVVREQIRKCKELTDKPFGVNVMLMNPNADEVADIVIEEGVKAVTTGAGNPAKYIAKWKEAGVKVMPVVASCAMAKLMERAGADAVVAEGMESGGHIGSITTMCLLPQVVDTVSIPVIGAGGIADGRGFMAALTVADAYATTGAFKNILVIGTESLSRIVDWSDRGTCILFGDGAGAVVVTADEENKMIFSLGADGFKADALTCTKNAYVTMDGRAVYRFATTVVPECIQTALDKAGLKADDIDQFFLHQANARILEAVSKKVGQDISKFPMNLDRVGNMSSASIPVLLDEENRKGNIVRGSRLLLAGFGAGLTYGACILKW